MRSSQVWYAGSAYVGGPNRPCAGLVAVTESAEQAARALPYRESRRELLLGVVFGAEAAFGDDPRGGGRTNRKVAEDVRARGCRILPPDAALGLITLERAQLLFRRVNDVRPVGHLIETVVCVQEPIRHGIYADVFALHQNEEGRVTIGVAPGDLGYSWSSRVAFLLLVGYGQ